MEKLLITSLQNVNISFSEQTIKNLCTHWEQVFQANQRFNLTAITDPVEAVDKHYLDCLLPLEYLDKLIKLGDRVCDLGTGAGFPGMVLAIARREWEFTLMDSTQKKIQFLEETAAAIGMDNCHTLALRAEEAGRQPELRESFSWVTARAVASLRELVELSFPLLKVGGALLAYKGAACQQEIDEAANALKLLYGEPENISTYMLPGGDERYICVIRKTAATDDKYPRRPGMAHKRPL